MIKTTEQDSSYRHLDKMSINEILNSINKEDKTVPFAIEKCLPQIEKVVKVVSDCLISGGRLFYIGAGTSGRLGVIDASECPPTFGVAYDLVIGIMSGGDSAIRKAIEFAEDDPKLGWKDLQEYKVSSKDIVIGIAASGTTPYVVEALKSCNENNIATACITNNDGSPLAAVAQLPIECVVGPEFVTGSTRMKAGTAQKLILNMISTAVMIQIGRVEDNKMVNMQLSNKKLVQRGIEMVMNATGCSEKIARENLEKTNSVKEAIFLIRN